jgi:hypothetical protein
MACRSHKGPDTFQMREDDAQDLFGVVTTRSNLVGPHEIFENVFVHQGPTQVPWRDWPQHRIDLRGSTGRSEKPELNGPDCGGSSLDETPAIHG